MYIAREVKFVSNIQNSINEIGDNGVLALSEALKVNRSLTHLNLEYGVVERENDFCDSNQ